MKADDLPINSPCDEDWTAMRGDSERRFCDHCARHVHDLSAMTKTEASALLRSSGGERLCVRYTLEPDGGIRFRAPAPAPAPLVQLRARPPERQRPAALARAGVAAALLAACTPHTHEAPCADEPVVETREAIVQGELNEPTLPEIDVPPPPVLEPTPLPHVEPLPQVETPPPLPPERVRMGEAPVLMGDVAIEPDPEPPPPVEPREVKMGKVAIDVDEDVPCDTPEPAPRRF
ncbi:MAG: hypothetical protein R3A79_12375 [Nannocystaceae bacterium]